MSQTWNPRAPHSVVLPQNGTTTGSVACRGENHIFVTAGYLPDYEPTCVCGRKKLVKCQCPDCQTPHQKTVDV